MNRVVLCNVNFFFAINYKFLNKGGKFYSERVKFVLRRLTILLSLSLCPSRSLTSFESRYLNLSQVFNRRTWESRGRCLLFIVFFLFLFPLSVTFRY